MAQKKISNAQVEGLPTIVTPVGAIPTQFVSWTLNDANQPVGIAVPVPAGPPLTDMTWSGPGPGAFLTGTGLHGIVYDEVTQFVAWGQNTLDVTLVAQAAAGSPSEFLLPSVGFLDENNSGFDFSIQQGNGGPSTCRMQVHHQQGGQGPALLRTGLYSSNAEVVHGGAVTTFRWLDNGTTITMSVNGDIVGVFPSILPYNGRLGNPTSIFRRFGSMYVASNNNEHIYSATILGS